MKKRVLISNIYGDNDTTSWLRAYGPLSLMRDEVEIVRPRLVYNIDGSINLRKGWWKDWSNWVGVDVCLIHRPYGIVAAAIMAECKMHRVPLWVDHDDDLLAVTPQNPYSEEIRKGEKEFPSVEMSYKDADILTCSGKVMHNELREKYGRSDAILITTGLDDRFVKFKRPYTRSKKIAWRGSYSHLSDLQHFKSGIESIMRKHEGFDWHFFGIDPREVLNEKLFDGEYHQPLNLFAFTDDLCRTNASIHWVALEDNKFNRVKSNLSWLDATLAGSVVLGPSFEEWQGLPCARYSSLDNFESMFSMVLTEIDFSDGSDFHKRTNEKSWDYIMQNLLTSKLNQKRLEILRNV